MRVLCILFASLFLVSSFTLASAGSEKRLSTDIDDTVEEILSTMHGIFKSSVKLAEMALEEVQRELREGRDSLQRQTYKSMLDALEKLLAELRRLEEALKKNLAENKGLSEEELNKHRRNRDKLEEKLVQLRERITEVTKEIEEECRLMRESIKEKVKDIVEEMEKAVDVLRERLKRQRD